MYILPPTTTPSANLYKATGQEYTVVPVKKKPAGFCPKATTQCVRPRRLGLTYHDRLHRQNTVTDSDSMKIRQLNVSVS